jgi:hypothetical protein
VPCIAGSSSPEPTSTSFRQYEFAVDDLDSFVDKQLSVHVVDVSHK